MTLNRPRSRSQNFHIRYLEYHERYNVRHNGGRIGNHEWAFDWHHDFWHQMTLDSPSSRSSKLHVKYLKYDDRYRQHWTNSEFAWTLSCFTARAYARAVLGVVILSVRLSVCLSVCLSHACIVTKLNDALQIFLYHTKRQSLCYSDTKSDRWATHPSLWNLRSKWPTHPPSKNADFDRFPLITSQP